MAGNWGDSVHKVLEALDDLPEHSVRALVSALEQDAVTAHNLEEAVGISGPKADLVRGLLADEALDRRALAGMLAVGAGVLSRTRGRVDSAEVVWTGPGKIGEGMRNTLPVIEEMLDSVVPGERVTVIGYMVTARASSIMSRMNALLEGGTHVDFIVDRNNQNRRELQKCFEKSLRRPTVYTRRESEHESYKIHAKVIMTGERRMLLGSANLTGLGTEVNFELGLLVTGPVVRKTHRLIRDMIRDGYFVRTGWM